MTNGQKCHGLILNVLSTLELTVEQKAKLDKAARSNGTYEPTDLMEDIQDINEMLSEGNIDGMLARLKIYPPTPQGADIRYYIDGKECSLERFNNMKDNLGVRTFGGKDAPSTETNTMWMTTGTRPDSPYSKGMGGRNSIMKNSTSGSGRQGGINSSDHERM